jgi:hypothetical protein
MFFSIAMTRIEVPLFLPAKDYQSRTYLSFSRHPRFQLFHAAPPSCHESVKEILLHLVTLTSEFQTPNVCVLGRNPQCHTM